MQSRACNSERIWQQCFPFIFRQVLNNNLSFYLLLQPVQTQLYTLYYLCSSLCLYLWYFTSPVCVLCLCVCVWYYIPAGISSQLTDSMFPSSQLCPWVLRVASPSAMLHSPAYKPPPPPLHTRTVTMQNLGVPVACIRGPCNTLSRSSQKSLSLSVMVL